MELKGLKVNFLGDSITEGAGASSPEHNYVNVFARKTGAIVRNYGIGGTRIAPQSKENFGPSFVDRAPDMDPDADLIVVFGGTNDFGHGDAPFGNVDEIWDRDKSTFCGAMRALLTELAEKFPTTRVVVLTPLHRCSEMVTTNEIGLPCHILHDYVEAERRICEYYSVPVLDLWSVSGIQPCIPASKKQYTADGLHPNDCGMERVADLLIGFLRTL